MSARCRNLVVALAAIALALTAGYAAIHLAAGTPIAPAQHSVAPPPDDLRTEDVEITSDYLQRHVSGEYAGRGGPFLRGSLGALG